MALIDEYEESGNGAAVDAELDRRPVTAGGHKIATLDGVEIPWRIGERLPLLIGGRKLHLRAGSYFVLGLIDRINSEYLDKISEFEGEVNKMKTETSVKALIKNPDAKALIKDLVKFRDSGLYNDTKSEEEIFAILLKIISTLSGDIAVELYANARAREIAARIKKLSQEGRFKVAQIIFLDAADARDKTGIPAWKRERREPNEDELKEVLTLEQYENDFSKIEIENLLHVYHNLNYPPIEKKDFLNLRLPN